jgi:hypothetical protein
MSYTAIHTDPDENAHIRSRFRKLVAAMCYYGVRDYTKSVYWWEVTLPNGIVAALYSVSFLNGNTYLKLDEDEFLISDQICMNFDDVIDDAIKTYQLDTIGVCPYSLDDFHRELMEYVYDYYPEWVEG